MALCFAQGRFEGKRADGGVWRDVLTAVLAVLFKDQQELSAGQPAAFAELWGVTPAA